MGESAVVESSKAVFGNDLKIMIANDFRYKSDTFAVHTVGKILKLRLLSLYIMELDDASSRLCSTATQTRVEIFTVLGNLD